MVDRGSAVGGPDLPGRFEPRDSLPRAAAHLHHVSDDVYRGAVLRFELERATGRHLRRRIVAGFLEPECVHAEDVAESRDTRVPLRKDLRHTIAQHFALAEPEVERMRNLQSEAVARIVDHQLAV